jgi:hypothetical protein
MPLSIVDIAVESFLSGTTGSLRRSARIHGVAKSTVSDRKCGRKSVKEARQEKQKLFPGEESALAGHVSTQTMAGYPIDGPTIRSLATVMLERRTDLFSGAIMERLGKCWHEAFLGRFTELMVEQTRVMEWLRIDGALRPTLEYYYKLFEKMLEVSIKENIYNMDETGVMFGIQNRTRCIVDINVKNRICKSSQTRESATIMECISASGVVLLPMVIIAVKTHPNEWYPEGEPGPGLRHFAKSPNGYTGNELGLEWLEKVFEPQTRERAGGRWQLLVCDGHGSHETVDFLTFCFTHRIYLLRLPLHTSHLTQPLDVGCFSPLKQAYRRLVKEECDKGIKTISKRLFMYLYKKARDDAFSSRNITQAWKGAGLFSLDPEWVISVAIPRPSTPPAQVSSAAPAPPTTPGTPRSSLDVRTLQRQILSSSAPLSPHAQLSILKICEAAQRAMGEVAILRYDNRALWHRVYRKCAMNATRCFIVSRAPVVSERDIMEARHAKNYVKVLAIEWPEKSPL